MRPPILAFDLPCEVANDQGQSPLPRNEDRDATEHVQQHNTKTMRISEEEKSMTAT